MFASLTEALPDAIFLLMTEKACEKGRPERKNGFVVFTR